MKADFVSDLIALVEQVANTDGATSAKLEQELRNRYGGELIRIRREAPITLQVINDALYQGKHVRQIAVEHGVSRATIYRHLNKNRKKMTTCDTPAG